MISSTYASFRSTELEFQKSEKIDKTHNEEKAMQRWAGEELQAVQLGDARLNRRLVEIVDVRDAGSTADG